MRYCNECGKKQDWPLDTLMQVFGPCELCSITQGCNDIHHSQLPMPEAKLVPDNVTQINQDWEKLSRDVVGDQIDILIGILNQTKDMIHSKIYTDKGLVTIHSNIIHMIASSETLFLEREESEELVTVSESDIAIALRQLLEFLDEEHLTDCEAYDGDGRVDTWQSDDFEAVIKRAKEVMNHGKKA